MWQATIKEVTDREDGGVGLKVEYSDGKGAVTKDYSFLPRHIESRADVDKVLQAELDGIKRFQEVVEELRADVDKPVGVAKVVEP